MKEIKDKKNKNQVKSGVFSLSKMIGCIKNDYLQKECEQL